MVNGRLCLFTLTPEPVYSWCSSSSCSSESLWWRSYAESESTAALSSSSLSWVQSSSNSSRTPSWRRQTSWRWQSVSWDACSSREDWWSTSTSCSLPLMTPWQRLTSLLWAPRSTTASPNSSVQSAAPPGGRGRHLQTAAASRQTHMSWWLKDYWTEVFDMWWTCCPGWTEDVFCVFLCVRWFFLRKWQQQYLWNSQRQHLVVHVAWTKCDVSAMIIIAHWASSVGALCSGDICYLLTVIDRCDQQTLSVLFMDILSSWTWPHLNVSDWSKLICCQIQMFLLFSKRFDSYHNFPVMLLCFTAGIDQYDAVIIFVTYWLVMIMLIKHLNCPFYGHLVLMDFLSQFVIIDKWSVLRSICLFFYYKRFIWCQTVTV